MTANHRAVALALLAVAVAIPTLAAGAGTAPESSAAAVDGYGTPLPSEPSQTTWIPVATHANGQNNSMWRTTLGILNNTSATANIVLRLQTSGGVLSSTTQVGPGVQAILNDVVAQISPTFSGSAALQVVSDQPVMLMSRTFNLVAGTASCYPNGTFGQDYPAFVPADGLVAGQSGYLTGLSESSAFRSNIALVNAGTGTARVLVELFNGAGTRLTEYTVDLTPGQWKQESQPFKNKAAQTNMARGYARVTVQSGAGVLAFASIIDAPTGDPTTVTLQR